MPGVSPDAVPADRIHALDHLRALAMLAGVLFHAALAYSPLLAPVWPPADRQTWWGVDALIWLPHLVRMPLFFLIAGYFTASLLERRGMGGLARQRARRILLPFLVAWPLVDGSLALATEWAASAVTQSSPMLRLIRDWLALPDPPGLPPRTGHLWFLYYLLLFGVVLWAVRALGWGGGLARLMARGPQAVAGLLPLVLWPGFMATGSPHPAPESLLPEAWALAVFGPFYALGLGLHGRLDWLTPLRPWLKPAAALCLGLYAVLLDHWTTDATVARTAWATALLEALIAAWGTLLALALGLRWLARPSPLLRYLSASAYWTYLVHLPLLFALQYPMMDLGWPWPLKFATAVSATTALCLLSYELLVRRTPLQRFVG
ncbi:MAG: acyltransferase family protein [Vicinamibacteria bacterium]|nr:acyltransferase family protein [Vicinamibacteria bacterium]